MKMRRVLVLGAVVPLLILGGCSEIKNQVENDLARPDQPTVEGLEVRLYLDQSDSSKELRTPIGDKVKETFNTRPDYLRVHRSYFSQGTPKGDSQKISSSQDLDAIKRDWVKVPANEPRRTHYADAFNDARINLSRSADVKSVVVIASDGGFEDPTEARAAARALASAPNLAMVVFVGVNTANSDKREQLLRLIDAMKQQRKDLEAHIVGLDSSVEVRDVQEGLKGLVQSHGKRSST